MTASLPQKRAFTLTIANGNQGRIVPVSADTPPEPDAKRFERRIKARAQLAAVYAGLLGVQAVPRDLFEAIGGATRERAGEADEATAICHGFSSIGLLADTSRVSSIGAVRWPCAGLHDIGPAVAGAGPVARPADDL